MISTLLSPTILWFHGSVPSSGWACGSPSGFGTTFGARNMIVEAKDTKVTIPRETKMVSTKKSVHGLRVLKPCSTQLLKVLLVAWDIPGVFVKYIYQLSEEKPQWNGAWQLYLHFSCTDSEWKEQKENHRVIFSPEKSQGNLALQVDFLTLPTPAKNT